MHDRLKVTLKLDLKRGALQSGMESLNNWPKEWGQATIVRTCEGTGFAWLDCHV